MPWITEQEWNALREQLNRIERKIDRSSNEERMIMGQVEDLTAAVSSLATGFSALEAAIQKLQTAEPDNPAVAAAITEIKAVTTRMAADVAAIAPAPAPAPDPAPPTGT